MLDQLRKTTLGDVAADLIEVYIQWAQCLIATILEPYFILLCSITNPDRQTDRHLLMHFATPHLYSHAL